jgi:hypothetical protein
VASLGHLSLTMVRIAPPGGAKNKRFSQKTDGFGKPFPDTDSSFCFLHVLLIYYSSYLY